jgi:hypothetical protein
MFTDLNGLFPHSHTTEELFAKSRHLEKQPYRTPDEFKSPISASQVKEASSLCKTTLLQVNGVDFTEKVGNGVHFFVFVYFIRISVSGFK